MPCIAKGAVRLDGIFIHGAYAPHTLRVRRVPPPPAKRVCAMARQRLQRRPRTTRRTSLSPSGCERGALSVCAGCGGREAGVRRRVCEHADTSARPHTRPRSHGRRRREAAHGAWMDVDGAPQYRGPRARCQLCACHLVRSVATRARRRRCTGDGSSAPPRSTCTASASCLCQVASARTVSGLLRGTG